MLVNAKGGLLARGPQDVVRDQKREDGAIINGVSCFFCHAEGMFAPPPDQVRKTTGGILTGEDQKYLFALFDEDRIQAAIKEDTTRFKRALDACGVAYGSGAREPVRTLYEQFRESITAASLASEFGQRADTFLSDMARSSNEDVRLLAAKLKGGVPIPRANFIANFQLITHALQLGTLRPFTDPGFEEFGGQKASFPRRGYLSSNAPGRIPGLEPVESSTPQFKPQIPSDNGTNGIMVPPKNAVRPLNMKFVPLPGRTH